MTDRAVEIGKVLACILWVGVVGMMVAAWILERQLLGQIGLAMSALAATVTIRCYFVAYGRLLRSAAFIHGANGTKPRGVK